MSYLSHTRVIRRAIIPNQIFRNISKRLIGRKLLRVKSSVDFGTKQSSLSPHQPGIEPLSQSVWINECASVMISAGHALIILAVSPVDMALKRRWRN